MCSVRMQLLCELLWVVWGRMPRRSLIILRCALPESMRRRHLRPRRVLCGVPCRLRHLPQQLLRAPPSKGVQYTRVPNLRVWNPTDLLLRELDPLVRQHSQDFVRQLV